ncbi:MAG: prepilin-type N-terminal cleavage/methylation domain-containing protein [Candidatus Uhrbacteria bacterium]
MRVPRGFSMLEILIVVSLLTALFGVGLSASSTLKNVIAARGARQVESLLLTAAGKARNGTGGTSWGLYLSYDATTRKASSATVFSGTSYAARDASKDKVFPLDKSLRLSTVLLSGSGSSSGNDHEVVFTAFSGTTTQYGSLTVDTYDRSTTIDVSPSGTIARPTL